MLPIEQLDQDSAAGQFFDGTTNSQKDDRAMIKTKKALVIGAHPDDCALGAAGFSVLLRRSGWHVTFLTMTDGELGGDPLVRLDEERAAAQLLDVSLDFGHLPDGSMSGRDTVEVLEAKLDLHKPDLILTHAPTDSHADHRVLSDSLVSAARRSASILFYEGPSTLEFNAALKIDVARTWDLKVKSLLAHASQRERVRTVEWAEAAGRHRAWPHYRGICEAFSPVRMDLELIVEVAAQAQAPMITASRSC
jgi:LmbE family N-acetylglucosaminyl deacetylase